VIGNRGKVRLVEEGRHAVEEIKVEVLKEGFKDLLTDPNVEVASRAAESETESKEISIPLHRDSGMI
jgi:hypothetical protein